jgi:hypothetical protein
VRAIESSAPFVRAMQRLFSKMISGEIDKHFVVFGTSLILTTIARGCKESLINRGGTLDLR